MKIMKLTPHQHSAIYSIFNMDQPELESTIPGLVLGRTFFSFPDSELDEVCHVVSDAIWFARSEGDRGAGNALHSVARKIEEVCPEAYVSR